MDSDGINAFTAILEHLKTLWDAELLQKTKGDDVGEYRITFTAGMPHILRDTMQNHLTQTWECSSKDSFGTAILQPSDAKASHHGIGQAGSPLGHIQNMSNGYISYQKGQDTIDLERLL